MSTSNTSSTPRRRWPIIALVFVAIAAIVATIWFVPKGATNGDATPQVTETAGPTNGATDNPNAGDSDTPPDPEDVPWQLANWPYPGQYADLAKKYDYGIQKNDNGTPDDKTDDIRFPIFVIGSLETDKTIWPDSVRGPLTVKTLEELVARTLAEPDFCAMNAVELYNVELTSGGTVVWSGKDEMSWVPKWFPVTEAGINEWAAQAMGSSPKAQYVTAQKCALVAATIEQVFVDKGVMGNITTRLNIHIKETDAKQVDPANPFGHVREFEQNPIQYTGEFLVLAYELKGQVAACEAQVMWNIGDGRFALPDCTPKVTTPPPGGGSSWCPYPKVVNSIGECVTGKSSDASDYVYIPGGTAAPQTSVDNGVTVYTTEEDDDTTDETAGGDGSVSD